MAGLRPVRAARPHPGGDTVTGDTPCYATNVACRTDTASARSFLAPYVNLS